MDDLENRVRQFISLSLPGQPMSMHMGTSRLVNDLWREVQRLRLLTSGAVDFACTCEVPHLPIGGEGCERCGGRVQSQSH